MDQLILSVEGVSMNRKVVSRAVDTCDGVGLSATDSSVSCVSVLLLRDDLGGEVLTNSSGRIWRQ